MVQPIGHKLGIFLTEIDLFLIGATLIVDFGAALQTLYLGAGIALVIGALTAFVRFG